MVLAAGRGERMRPLTETTPKPLIALHGQAMIDTILDRVAAAGVNDAVVNLHHLGHKLEEHLKARKSPRVRFSPETTLLETGGGVKLALPLLGSAPFYAINGDIFWLDGALPALERLAAAWDGEKMDALLLLQSTVTAFNYDGAGDFQLMPDGKLRRRREREIAPFVFAGLQILDPSLFADAPSGPFSLNRLYDRAAESGRLYGLRHDGEWFHIGTPQSLVEAERELGFLLPGAARS